MCRATTSRHPGPLSVLTYRPAPGCSGDRREVSTHNDVAARNQCFANMSKQARKPVLLTDCGSNQSPKRR